MKQYQDEIQKNQHRKDIKMMEKIKHAVDMKEFLEKNIEIQTAFESKYFEEETEEVDFDQLRNDLEAELNMKIKPFVEIQNFKQELIGFDQRLADAMADACKLKYDIKQQYQNQLQSALRKEVTQNGFFITEYLIQVQVQMDYIPQILTDFIQLEEQENQTIFQYQSNLNQIRLQIRQLQIDSDIQLRQLKDIEHDKQITLHEIEVELRIKKKAEANLQQKIQDKKECKKIKDKQKQEMKKPWRSPCLPQETLDENRSQLMSCKRKLLNLQQDQYRYQIAIEVLQMASFLSLNKQDFIKSILNSENVLEKVQFLVKQVRIDDENNDRQYWDGNKSRTVWQ